MRACWEAEPAERPTFTQMRDKLDMMLEESLDESSAYLSVNADGLRAR